MQPTIHQNLPLGVQHSNSINVLSLNTSNSKLTQSNTSFVIVQGHHHDFCPPTVQEHTR